MRMEGGNRRTGEEVGEKKKGKGRGCRRLKEGVERRRKMGEGGRWKEELEKEGATGRAGGEKRRKKEIRYCD